MNDDEIGNQIRDYYESMAPSSSLHASRRVAAVIKARRNSHTHQSLRLWGPVAAAAMVAAALVGVPIFLGPAALPVSSGASGPAGSASSAAVEVTPSATGPYKVLMAAAGVGADWSPDGRWLAVWGISVLGATQDLTLLDSAGNIVRSLDGDRLVWVDATHYLLGRGNAAFVGSVDSQSLTSIARSMPADALSNGHGAVALTTTDSSDATKTSFVVWTLSGESRTIAGDPEAWSSDGTKVAVWHANPASGRGGVGYQYTGWIEVLSWPSLDSLASFKDGELVQQPTSFSPSGRYLLVSALGQVGSHVVDLTTGATVGPSREVGAGAPVWDSADDLLVPAINGSVTSYAISGDPSHTLPEMGDQISSSPTGTTILFYFSQDYTGNPRPVAFLRNGVSRQIQVPGGLESDPAISRDGSGVVVFCLVNHGDASEETEALLLL